jgi:LPS export ABC transporter protein LptC
MKTQSDRTNSALMKLMSDGFQQRFIFLFTFILTVIFLGGCEGKVKPSISWLGTVGDIPSQESWNAAITFTDSGRITAVLRAGHIATFDEKKITLLDSNVTVDFYDDSGRHTSVLTARRGIVNDVNHDFEAHENVVVVSDSGTTLVTQELYWTNATQKVHSPADVEITSPKEFLQGQGFESDRGLKHYTVFKVKGKAKTNDAKQ